MCGSGTTGCHGWIENNADKAGKEGWHVRPWEDPDEVPIKILRQYWYQLLDNGEVSESDEPSPDGEQDDDGEEDGLATGSGDILRGSREQDIPDPLPPSDQAE